MEPAPGGRLRRGGGADEPGSLLAARRGLRNGADSVGGRPERAVRLITRNAGRCDRRQTRPRPSTAERPSSLGQSGGSNPEPYSAELWFKTTTTGAASYRLRQHDQAGSAALRPARLHAEQWQARFGVNNGAQQTVATANGLQRRPVAPRRRHPGRGRDEAVGRQPLVGTNAATVGRPTSATGGSGATETWSTTSNYFAGTLDEVAVYPRCSAEQQVREHYSASGRHRVNRPPVASFTATESNLERRVSTGRVE